MSEQRYKKPVKQPDRLRALEACDELLHMYRASRASHAERSIEEQGHTDKMFHLSQVESYDEIINKLLLIREVLDNSMRMARRLAELLS